MNTGNWKILFWASVFYHHTQGKQAQKISSKNVIKQTMTTGTLFTI